jgi:hypothetical protein
MLFLAEGFLLKETPLAIQPYLVQRVGKLGSIAGD